MSVICWFRKGLRLHDNPALARAVAVAAGGGGGVHPVFVLDPKFWERGTVGILRARFLIDALADLDASLRRLGSQLYVARGHPDEVLPRLYKKWGIKHLTFEADSEPYAKKRDAAAQTAADAAGVQVEQFHSHTLHELEHYVGLAKGSTPTSYGAFQKLFNRMPRVPKPEPAVGDIPAPPGAAGGDAAAEFALPTLAELGYPEIAAPHKVLYPGGETAGLKRMEEHMKRKLWVCAFEKPKTSPNALEPATTVLSPYLKFGCLSARLFYHELDAIYKSTKGKHAQPPVSLHGQLLWREFFYLCGHAVPNFGQMDGNPICRQIPWSDDAEMLAAWREARTGYPFIDAIMTQLRTEGWVHHLARHAVACFLTRGDLWQSWEKGAAVFDELLLDADWSINSANWMWLSCSSFFYQYFRCYSPVAFGKKTDPDGLYIKKYLPQLRKFPKKFIYEPWTAPLAVQRDCGCVVGTDYPKPIVDHGPTSKANMAKMKAAYDAHKAGGGGGAAKGKGGSVMSRPAKKARMT